MLYHKEIYWKPSFDNVFRASWYGVKYIDFTKHMQERLSEKHLRVDKKFIIKTIWLNYKTDRHDNLDFNKYERGYRQCN